MNVRVTDIIAADEPGLRDLAIDRWCTDRNTADLLAACSELEAYHRTETNLYRRVRALFFLSSIHRYHLPARADFPRTGPQVREVRECGAEEVSDNGLES